jgi:hypothetical protein
LIWIKKLSAASQGLGNDPRYLAVSASIIWTLAAAAVLVIILTG